MSHTNALAPLERVSLTGLARDGEDDVDYDMDDDEAEGDMDDDEDEEKMDDEDDEK